MLMIAESGLPDAANYEIPDTFMDDPQKVESLAFLLENLDRHNSYDTTGFYRYGPFIDSLAALPLGEKRNRAVLAMRFNGLWDSLSREFPPGLLKKRRIPDTKLLTLEYLVKETETALSRWHQNPYYREANFDIFREHLLPYRIINGPLADSTFRDDLSGIVNAVYPSKIEDAVDSILIRYENIRHTDTFVPSFPYVSAAHILHTNHTDCDERVWFNYSLLRSAGLPSAIDFVPAWGNRNAAHVWNTVITREGAIPFEPFYTDDRWMYRFIYNNEAEDGFVEWWGKFRLPKVYRYLYQYEPLPVLADKNVPMEDIPPFFRSGHIRDVSREYFKAAKVKIEPTVPAPDNARYLYLCVSRQKEWIPVAVAPLNDGQAMFQDMGRDIVYLPAYYKMGKLIPAGDPFYLDQEGTFSYFRSIGTTHTMSVTRRYPANEKKEADNSRLQGCWFEVANRPDFSDGTPASCIDFQPLMKPYTIRSTARGKYRYVRFHFHTGAILSELKIHEYIRGQIETIEPKTVTGDFIRDDYTTFILSDGDLGTPLRYKEEYLEPQLVTIDYDLGVAREISSFTFCGIYDTFCLLPGNRYEVSYWDGRWISLGKRTAQTDTVVYEGVPEGVLFYIEDETSDLFKRIFGYENNKQLFY